MRIEDVDIGDWLVVLDTWPFIGQVAYRKLDGSFVLTDPVSLNPKHVHMAKTLRMSFSYIERYAQPLTPLHRFLYGISDEHKERLHDSEDV